MSEVYDLGIVGAGVAGAFSALRAVENHKNSKVIIFDYGRAPGKRRKRQLEGFLGCFPIGDGKLYPDDIYKILEVSDGRKVKPLGKWVDSYFEEVGPFKLNKTKLPDRKTQLLIEKSGFSLKKHDYIQWKPDSVHKLSRLITSKIEDVITFSFDNEVTEIHKIKDIFHVTTEKGNFECKKIIISVGRSGWRWASDLFKKFDLSFEDDYAYFGVRFECASQYMRNFQKSHCSFAREDISVGPLCWSGTVIPEDHADLVISAFRSNEERWKTDKVSFSLIGKRHFKGKGSYESERLGKLAYLLYNDRVDREKVKNIITKTSKISELPEYDWLSDVINELESFMPNLISRGYFHAPNIWPSTVKIPLNSSFESEVTGLFVAGENSSISGIVASAISGAVATDGALKWIIKL